MDLPKAADLRDIFAAARENGVTHLRIGAFEVKLAPQAAVAARPGVDAVAAINGAAPLPEDPLDVVRRQAGIETDKAQRPPKGDEILDMLGNGARFIPVGGPADPTSPA